MIGGRYSLDREIGRGGMGAVWLGRDEVLGRAVAIKRVGVMPGGSSPDLLRAEREARIAARLNHPHVVAVFDLVHEEDQQYLVMEYVEGSTLAELVRTAGPLAPDQAAPVIAQAADALRAAHGAGIVHRDVKPSNILVTEDGQVKLSDFGIARAQADASLTQTGLVTGSPAYLAPEVASGQVASATSDVWSLGATLYHALDGNPPYDVGDNVLGALYRIVHEEPPRLANAGWLAPLLESTMTRDPDERWSMDQVADFLRTGAPPVTAVRPAAPAIVPASVAAPPAETTGTQLLTSPSATPAETPRPPAKRRGRSGLLFPILVGFAIVAFSLMAFLIASEDDQPQPDNPPASPPSDSPTTDEPSESQSQSPTEPDEQDMEDFITGYLQTASSNPERAFAQLTPGFQDASGGLSGYRGFWDQVSNPSVQSISADADALTVSYTYSFTFQGDEMVDEVRLQLEFDEEDGTYLIAGEG